jgi:hypothetical protein
MADHEHDEANAEEATGVSGFGGHILADSADAFRITPPNGDADPIAAAAQVGILDADQLIGIAANPDVQGALQTALKLEDADFQQFIDQALDTLPAERRSLVSAPAPTFGLGVRPVPAEEIDDAEAASAAEPIAMEVAAIAAAPPSANLIPYMPPIRQQGQRGTCVSFTLTALNEYVLSRRGFSVNLSEQHMYYEIKLIDRAPAACGTWQVDAVNALRNRGQCRETVWPYNINYPPCNNHGAVPAQARADGLYYRLNTISVPRNNVLAYKGHISQERPVTLSIPVYDSWYRSAETRRSGRITLRLADEPRVGGHAVLLVGYQDEPSQPGGGYFILRNSWGTTTWGYECPHGAGYGTIPYQYIINDADEAFTA